MVGLNCGTPSLIAWPRVSAGVDRLVSVGDEAARQAMRDLADVGIVAGETGAAALAGFNALIEDDKWSDWMGDLQDKTVMLVVTEGATDPGSYAEIAGRGHGTIGRVITAAR